MKLCEAKEIIDKTNNVHIYDWDDEVEIEYKVGTGVHAATFNLYYSIEQLEAMVYLLKINRQNKAKLEEQCLESAASNA